MNTPVFLVGFFAPLVLHNYKNNHSVINSTVSDINETITLIYSKMSPFEQLYYMNTQSSWL